MKIPKGWESSEMDKVVVVDSKGHLEAYFDVTYIYIDTQPTRWEPGSFEIEIHELFDKDGGKVDIKTMDDKAYENLTDEAEIHYLGGQITTEE